MSNHPQSFFSIMLAAFVIAVSTPVYSQDYPTKSITMIVPTGPGATSDAVGRIISAKLGEVLGRTVVVENKTGAGGIIGIQAAAKAAPDGYTLMISASSIAMSPALYKTAPYDPVQSFIPITTIGRTPFVLVVNPQIPVGSFDEFIALAKRKPDGLSYGSAGNGSPNHLWGELLNKTAGVKILHIPYKGMAAAVADVVGGRVSMASVGLTAVHAFINSGRLKAIAVTSPRRMAGLPNVPTVGESIPGYSAEVWFGLFAVANTPEPITARLYAATLKALDDPDTRKRLTDIGVEIEPRNRAEFQSLIQAELEQWSKVVRDSQGAIVRQ